MGKLSIRIGSLFLIESLQCYLQRLMAISLLQRGNKMPELDLVDEMQWEDLVEFETLESAGLEDSFIADSVPAAQKEYYNDEF